MPQPKTRPDSPVPSLQGPCERSLKSEEPCGSCLNWIANFRRDGYDFDALWEDGKARHADKALYELLEPHAPIPSRALKDLGGYGKEGRKGFDQSITRLQHLGYVLISDFVYDLDRQGKPYGWGVAEYSTPEKHLGREFRKNVYRRTPEESFERVLNHLKEILPNASEKALRQLLK